MDAVGECLFARANYLTVSEINYVTYVTVSSIASLHIVSVGRRSVWRIYNVAVYKVFLRDLHDSSTSIDSLTDAKLSFS